MPGTGIHALILAAGASRRFGSENKLLEKIDGRPLIRHVARQVLASKLSRVHVVTGHDEAGVREALGGLDLSFIHNPEFEAGLSTSLRRGLAGLGDDVRGAMVVLGDMPGIDTALLDALVELFQDHEGGRIAFPVLPDGRQANPVIWPSLYFKELARVEGDRGGRDLIGKFSDATAKLPVGEEKHFEDIDEPGDISRYRGQGTSD